MEEPRPPQPDVGAAASSSLMRGLAAGLRTLRRGFPQAGRGLGLSRPARAANGESGRTVADLGRTRFRRRAARSGGRLLLAAGRGVAQRAEGAASAAGPAQRLQGRVGQHHPAVGAGLARSRVSSSCSSISTGARRYALGRPQARRPLAASRRKAGVRRRAGRAAGPTARGPWRAPARPGVTGAGGRQGLRLAQQRRQEQADRRRSGRPAPSASAARPGSGPPPRRRPAGACIAPRRPPAAGRPRRTARPFSRRRSKSPAPA